MKNRQITFHIFNLRYTGTYTPNNNTRVLKIEKKLTVVWDVNYTHKHDYHNTSILLGAITLKKN